ncbi:MAG: hypothetical protein Q9207_001786 [Kuettlingeria erythrocarpa]
MAITRGASGITVPTNHFIPTLEPASRQPSKKASNTKKPVANSSKPRVKKTAAGRVAKPTAPKAPKAPKESKAKKAASAAPKKKTAPKTENHREPSLMDKVQGVAEHIAGVLEGNPAKKAAGTKKIRGTDGKGATRAKKAT